MSDSRQHPAYLPRLPRPYYQADAIVHWTLTPVHGSRLRLDPGNHSLFRELVLHAAHRERLISPAYCLMPDHLHVVWMGLDPKSDQLNGMAFFRGQWTKAMPGFSWQSQAHDRVLRGVQRSGDPFRVLLEYLLLNPVRAGLVADPAKWPWSGCIIPGLPCLHPSEARYWRLLFDQYARRRDPACDRHMLPPL